MANGYNHVILAVQTYVPCGGGGCGAAVCASTAHRPLPPLLWQCQQLKRAVHAGPAVGDPREASY